MKFPPEMNEIFINFNNAPLFWAAQTPLSNYLEKFLKKSLANVGGVR